MFTDTHCHIFKEYYENINEILETAKIEVIEKVLTKRYK